MKSLLSVLFISMLPVIELRGAIPYGLAMKLPFWKVLFCSVAGNCIIVFPLLWLFNKGLHYIVHLPVVGTAAAEWFAGVEKKTDFINRYGFWGLVMFVAVPLPGSGVWSGALAASLLEMNMITASAACVSGVLIASAFVALASLGIINMF